MFTSPLSRFGKYLVTIHLDFKEQLLIIFCNTVHVYSTRILASIQNVPHK